MLDRHFRLFVFAITALICAAVAPTLPWQEFSNSVESLNVATALEIRREGNWLIPTLQGETRLAKPPLTAWITAACISDRTMGLISSGSPAERAAGFGRLAWEVRLPALLAGCITLILIAHIGRALAGAEVGVLGLTMAGTSLLFLRFTRYATTDTQLTLWTTATTALLIDAMTRRRWWPGCLGAGLTLSLAFLAKGPVSLLMSVVPVGLYLLWRRRAVPMLPMLCGAGVFLLAASPWFVLVGLEEPHAWRVWYSEASRESVGENGPSPWYHYPYYLNVVAYLAPWAVFLIVGLVMTAADLRARRDGPIVAAAILLVVPVIGLSLFPGRAERFLQPLVCAGAIATAIALQRHLLKQRWSAVDRVVNIGHWLIVAAFGVAFPIVTAIGVGGQRWHSPSVAAAAALFAVVLITVGIWMQRRAPSMLLLTTAAVMLAMQVLFFSGYGQSEQARARFRPMAEAILALGPDVQVYNAHPRGQRPPPDLGVYLNRTITWLANPGEIPRGSEPRVLLMYQYKGAAEPRAPDGWRLLAKWPRDRNWWWAFVLNPL